MATLLINLLAWSLQVTVVVLAAAIVARIVAIDAAGVRHAWWRGVLVLCLTLPLLQPWQRTAGLPIAFAALEDVGSANDDAAVVAAAPSRSPASRALPSTRALQGVAAGTLAAGIILRLLWLAAGLVRLRQLRRAGVQVPDTECGGEWPAQPGCAAEIRYVPAVGQPVTFGLRRPVVLLPAALRELPLPLQRAVLTHELWHVRRGDWAWVIVEELLRAVLWFHPAIWWLISRVQASREEVVDELSVLQTNARRSYVEALLVFADQPPLFPAAPFGRRRHLFNRMLLISQEAAMSSRRIIASSIGLLAALAAAGSYGVAAFPLTAAALPVAPAGQSQVRDPRPGDIRPASARELQLQTIVSTGSAGAAAFVELGRLQEQRGAVSEAEATFLALRLAQPNNLDTYGELAAFYRRAGQFDKAVQVLEEKASLSPADPQAQQAVATYYLEKALNDKAIGPVEQNGYVQRALDATDRALAAQPDSVEALVYKSMLLQAAAAGERDPARKTALTSEAELLGARARALREAMGAAAAQSANGAPPPPPPPPAPAAWAALVGGKTPVRIGGGIPAPLKTRDVRPFYPPIAQAARVAGVVILETLLDESGAVLDTRVVRSIPLLDDAAMEAVRQWRYVPTLLNGEAVPVVLTVTVNFSLQ